MGTMGRWDGDGGTRRVDAAPIRPISARSILGEGRPARRERVRTKAAEREAKRGTHDRRHVLAQIAEFWRSRSRAVSLANLAKG